MTTTEALAGIKVIDLTRVLAGPISTMWLGDMGADVIKIEQPGKGDDTRAWGPPFVGAESAYFLGANRNKRSMTLDLASEAGQDILKQLIKTADVVVDNFKLGTLDRWGLTDEWYDEHAPQIVRCTIAGYGSTGPKAGMAGYDFILQAETGLMAITGEPDGEAMKLGVAIVDICTGMLATMTILGAIQARHHTGRGQRTEVALHDSGIQMLANVASNQLISGNDAARFGNGHPNIVPYRTFATSDGDLALAVGNDGQFARMASLIGHDQWGTDPRFATNKDRVANREVLDGLIGDVLATKTRAEWIAVLEPAGVPCGPINSVTEALTSEQTKARSMVTTVDHAAEGPIETVGIPFQMFGTPPSVRLPPPSLGQHTAEILSGLGLDADAIKSLGDDGIT